MVDPGYRRTAPYLASGLKLVALANTAPADSPIAGTALAAGKQRRTAFRTEMLETRAVIVAGLGIGPERFSGDPDLFALVDHRHAIGRAGQGLAVRAVTDRNLLRIDVGLIGDEAAMALSDDMHLCFAPMTVPRADPRKKKRRPKAPFYHDAGSDFSARSDRPPLRPWRRVSPAPWCPLPR
jgi:hypothetical protein